MITLTDIHMQRLHAEAARLSEDADRLLADAEDTDDPDDWDAWKEADGIAAGFELALQEVAREASDPEPTPHEPSLTHTAWCADYRPLTNPCRDRTDAPFGGMMFETFGPELDAVRAADPACVWTLVQDGAGLYILSGIHVANRLGYFMTERPWSGDRQAEIRVD